MYYLSYFFLSLHWSYSTFYNSYTYFKRLFPFWKGIDKYLHFIAFKEKSLMLLMLDWLIEISINLNYLAKLGPCCVFGSECGPETGFLPAFSLWQVISTWLKIWGLQLVLFFLYFATFLMVCQSHWTWETFKWAAPTEYPTWTTSRARARAPSRPVWRPTFG